MKVFSPLMEVAAPETLGFAINPLDRAAQLRTRGEEIARMRVMQDARFYAFCGDHAVLPRAKPQPFFEHDALPGPGHWCEEIFLGLEAGAPRFALAIDPVQEDALKSDDSLLLIGLRALAFEEMVGPNHLGVIAQGKAMLHWHATHRFCAKCGQASKSVDAGWKRLCASCGAEHFPRTDPVVIMLTIDQDRCLLGRGPKFPPGWYSTLAGFVEPGETIEDAVRRETMEEAGILAGRVTIMANQPWPFPASLMIGAFVEACSTKIAMDLDELEDCRWFSRDEIRQMLVGTHPEGLGVPLKMSIAAHLIRHFVAMGD